MGYAALQNITPDRPLVIGTYEQLLDVVKVVLTDVGVIKGAKVEPDRLLNTRQAKSRLLEKGYHVKSHVAFKKLMHENNVVCVPKGRDDMWSSAEIDKIPNNY